MKRIAVSHRDNEGVPERETGFGLTTDRTATRAAPSMLQTKQLTFIYFSLTLIISILAFVVLSYRDTKPWIVTSVLSRERPKNGCHQA